MEHTITAPAAGTVKGLPLRGGDQVGDDAQLVDFEAHACRKASERRPHPRLPSPRRRAGPHHQSVETRTMSNALSYVHGASDKP